MTIERFTNGIRSSRRIRAIKSSGGWSWMKAKWIHDYT